MGSPFPELYFTNARTNSMCFTYFSGLGCLGSILLSLAATALLAFCTQVL